MSPIAETGKAVSGFFTTMKEHPLALALVVMNFALLGYIFYSGREMITMAYQSQKETSQLLSKCVDIEYMQLKQKP
jgi:ABC-type Na+ efflux pump permease subunit